MEGLLALVVAATGVAASLIVDLVVRRTKRNETYAGAVVDKSVRYHQTESGPAEKLWVLTIEDPAGKCFGRLVTEEFFEAVAVGDQVVKESGADIRRG